MASQITKKQLTRQFTMLSKLADRLREIGDLTPEIVSQAASEAISKSPKLEPYLRPFAAGPTVRAAALFPTIVHESIATLKELLLTAKLDPETIRSHAATIFSNFSNSGLVTADLEDLRVGSLSALESEDPKDEILRELSRQEEKRYEKAIRTTPYWYGEFLRANAGGDAGHISFAMDFLQPLVQALCKRTVDADEITQAAGQDATAEGFLDFLFRLVDESAMPAGVPQRIREQAAAELG